MLASSHIPPRLKRCGHTITAEDDRDLLLWALTFDVPVAEVQETVLAVGEDAEAVSWVLSQQHPPHH